MIGEPIPALHPSAATIGAMERTLVLVEGESDKAALLAVAARTGSPDRFSVTVMDGITNVARLVGEAAAEGLRLAGLYDAGAEDHVAAALTRAGLADVGPGANLEEYGFFRCSPDLEAELIAALGADLVIDIVSSQGEDLRRFRKLQQMPEWRDQPIEDQLRRWFGSGAGRKVRYAELLGDAVSPETVPPPLCRVLAFANGG